MLLAARRPSAGQNADIVLATGPADTALILRITGLERICTVQADASTATPPAADLGDRPPRGQRDGGVRKTVPLVGVRTSETCQAGHLSSVRPTRAGGSIAVGPMP
ncbi:hypothetical protein ACWD04_06810 [Streptomyces sp. NPDC002911]